MSLVLGNLLKDSSRDAASAWQEKGGDLRDSVDLLLLTLIMSRDCELVLDFMLI